MTRLRDTPEVLEGPMVIEIVECALKRSSMSFAATAKQLPLRMVTHILTVPSARGALHQMQGSPQMRSRQL